MTGGAELIITLMALFALVLIVSVLQFQLLRLRGAK